MDKTIMVELRTQNSRHLCFNREGDWRPRYIVWPEYDGQLKQVYRKTNRMDAETDASWGHIFAETVRDFCQKQGLNRIIFRRAKSALHTLSGRLSWAFKARGAEWTEESMGRHRLLPDYVSMREREGTDEVVYLLSETAVGGMDLAPMVHQVMLDRATLLPYGRGILALGEREPVAEICLDGLDDAFLQCLHTAAMRHDHRFERTGQHFLSYWVAAAHPAGFATHVPVF